MMTRDSGFDIKQAKKFLLRRDHQRKQRAENEREAYLQRTVAVLKKMFQQSDTEVYLIGSLVEPRQFTKYSDIDIVLKNFQGDKYDLWSQLETELNRTIDIILLENCSFPDDIIQYGLRVV